MVPLFARLPVWVANAIADGECGALDEIVEYLGRCAALREALQKSD